MPSKNRNALYDMFATGNKPTHDDFVDLIDSTINIADDGIGAAENGMPMEIVEQGTNRRLLDFSINKGTYTWRINAQSVDTQRNGLNITSANQSRMFLKQEDGSVGINSDNPAAKLHIVAESGPALRVDDSSQHPSLVIQEDGGLVIGTEDQTAHTVTINGKTFFNNEVTINQPVHAESGITVNGNKLNALHGLNVQNGVKIESGLLEAQNGLAVTGNLNANNGAVISGQTLEARKGLTVNSGAVVQTGKLEANDGATVSGQSLVVMNGLTVSNGAKIETGMLEAQAGATISGAILEVMNDLSVQGNTTFKNKIDIETGLLTAQGGLSVTNGSTLQANGQVTLGNSDTGNVIINGALYANKGIIVAKLLQAGAGAEISGSELIVNDGLTVYNGATIESGELVAKSGISITGGSALNTDGPVTLGSETGGGVTINGGLAATNGATISGSELVVENGITITGDLNAPGDSTLGKANIDTLTVNNINIAGNFGLQALDLDSVTADIAEIKNMTITNGVSILGPCHTSDNVIFNSGIIYATYEGSALVFPRIKIIKGTVTGEEGHFEISVDDTKRVTIIYDSASDIDNFLGDWNAYQNDHPEQAAGFRFTCLSTTWDLQDMEIGFTSTRNPYKECAIDDVLRIIYMGPLTGTIQSEFVASEDPEATAFEFEINESLLTIKYPGNTASCTVNQLLIDWKEWLNNLEGICDFDIQTVSNGEVVITDAVYTLEENVSGEIFSKGIIKTNTVSIQGYLKISGSQSFISSISTSDTLTENSDTVLSTQKAVKTYIDNKITVIDNALATKAVKADVDASLETINQNLATKAVKEDVDASLETINQSLATKAVKEDVNASLETINQSLATKAVKEDVNTSLETINRDLEEKAVKTEVDALLATKADLQKPASLTVAASQIVTVNNLTLTNDSRGLLMVLITKPGTSAAGLFAVHGTGSIVKIAGDGMSDQQDNPETLWNVYSDTGVVTIQNTDSAEVTVKVTYIGL